MSLKHPVDVATIVASIQALRQQGISAADIATRLKLDQATVLRVANGGTLPARQRAN